jgi:hypothetical protein
MPRKLACTDEDVREFDNLVLSELIYRNPGIKLSDEEYRRLLVAIEAWYIAFTRYGDLPTESKESLIRDYIVPVLRAHRDEIARVTNFELSDEFLNCLPRLYRIPGSENFNATEWRGREYFGWVGWERLFKEAEQLFKRLK